jgi:hypothetical protein
MGQLLAEAAACRCLLALVLILDVLLAEREDATHKPSGAIEVIDRDPERGACCTSSLMREACPDNDLNGMGGNGVELTEVTAFDSGSLVEA